MIFHGGAGKNFGNLSLLHPAQKPATAIKKQRHHIYHSYRTPHGRPGAHTSIPNSSAASAVGTAGMGGAGAAGPSRRRLRGIFAKREER